jgi:hypothetical protein
VDPYRTQAALTLLIGPRFSLQVIDSFGGAERDRTADLLVANEALSQLSYSPQMAIRTASCFRRLTHPANTISVPAPALSLKH